MGFCSLSNNPLIFWRCTLRCVGFGLAYFPVIVDLFVILKCEKGCSLLLCGLASFLTSAENVTMALLYVHYLSRAACLARQEDAESEGAEEGLGISFGGLKGEIGKQGKRRNSTVTLLKAARNQAVAFLHCVFTRQSYQRLEK